MYQLIAGCILLTTLPMLAQAEVSNGIHSPPVPLSDSESRTAPDKAHGDPVDTQSNAYDSCLRATQRFEQQEKNHKTGKVAIASLSASCQSELKPAQYWLCMEKEASEEVDFNTADWRCAKTLNH